MNDVELVYSLVQQEADNAKDFGLGDLARILMITAGIGIVLTLIGASL